MKNSAPKPRPAMEKLVESFTRLRTEARERMSEEELRRADEEFRRLADKVRARRKQALASLRG